MYSRIKKERPKYRQFTIIFPLFVVFFTSIYTITLICWPLRAITASIVEQPAIKASSTSISWPMYGQSALYATGYGSLGTHSSLAPTPIASITKIITALTILEKNPISDPTKSPLITFGQADIDYYNRYIAMDGVVAPVTPGQTISQYDMLQIMLIASANNYAESLAVWAYGSNEVFLNAANTYLTSHKLTNTSIGDPAGFSEDSVSTAADLVKIGELALNNPIIRDIVAKPSVTVAGIGTFYATNLLVTRNEAIGIKTGNTDAAGQCLLFAQKYQVDDQHITIYGSILGGDTRNQVAADAKTLLDEAAKQFKPVSFASAGQVFATYKTPWGAKANLVSKTKVSAVVWAGDATNTSVTAPPIKPGDPDLAGAKATFTSGDNKTDRALVLSTDLPKPSLLWRLSHPLTVIGI